MTHKQNNWMKRCPLTWATVFALVGVVCVTRAWAIEQDTAVKLCGEYLTSENRAVRQGLLLRLAAYEGEIEPVLRSLAKQSPRAVTPGYHGDEHFAAANLARNIPTTCSTSSCRKLIRRIDPPGSSCSCTAAGPAPRRGRRKRPYSFPTPTRRATAAVPATCWRRRA